MFDQCRGESTTIGGIRLFGQIGAIGGGNAADRQPIAQPFVRHGIGRAQGCIVDQTGGDLDTIDVVARREGLRAWLPLSVADRIARICGGLNAAWASSRNRTLSATISAANAPATSRRCRNRPGSKASSASSTAIQGARAAANPALRAADGPPFRSSRITERFAT